MLIKMLKKMNLRHDDFPNFGGFSLIYKSSIVPLAGALMIYEVFFY